ncbi:SAM-dependent methyltransferase [Paenibacillus agaridevorans]|uniref:SAM-dependent methyltransferase n=1 Tax=Paenibacillus agaridevorans TaxID=171404 RepID=UPI001BE3F155|nr:SAM-dependent methyltransferase [Paenibacillus agaridevorans]
MSVTNERRYRFSEAPIWEIQRQYYEEAGMTAWHNDQVPQYITSNPMIGGAYAEMIFGLLMDRAAQGLAEEPVCIVEVGAGVGRLACHVLHELRSLIQYADIPLPPFRYWMTDLAMSNVLAWKEHPALQPFLEDGTLDVARFDAVQDTELHLLVSGERIVAGALKQPLVIVANYFFDGIPQELLYMGDGRVYETDVFIRSAQRGENEGEEAAAKLDRLSLRYEHRPAPEYEQEDYTYRDLIAFYQEELDESHLLFPSSGFTCLERLHALSTAGSALITADKGDHKIDNWRNAPPPELIRHGGFSFTANYHAFQYVFERQGALALFPPQHYKNINVGCILRLDRPKAYVQTRLAYRRVVERFGPDEFYSLKEWLDGHLDTMGLQQFLGFWRLGGYDAEFFAQSARRISELLPDAYEDELDDITRGIELMWSSYYVMEQKYDLALDAGLILFEMDRYKEAKTFLEASVEAEKDEVVSTVYYCLAICCFEQEQEEEAVRYLKLLLELEPDHEEASALLQEFEK